MQETRRRLCETHSSCQHHKLHRATSGVLVVTLGPLKMSCTVPFLHLRGFYNIKCATFSVCLVAAAKFQLMFQAGSKLLIRVEIWGHILRVFPQFFCNETNGVRFQVFS
ncbi:hypothetical protein SRHO_G00284930 [Serrasalmus rhombeus]